MNPRASATIRRAAAIDEAALKQLLSKWGRDFTRGHYRYLIAEDRGDLTGVLAASEMEPGGKDVFAFNGLDPHQPIPFCSQIFVTARLRSRGIGGALLEGWFQTVSVDAEYSQAGIAAVMPSEEEGTADRIRFFQSHGFDWLLAEHRPPWLMGRRFDGNQVAASAAT